ncbi:hypothetical protein HAX54_005209 [Datura stramonium]|uniref:Uncharacterized protein n=1 Tax=Datura stramonium TaxID=4076 RepID=A0ABS8T9S4_DATST|nr:hypothetical protein [Datura stramonium]
MIELARRRRPRIEIVNQPIGVIAKDDLTAFEGDMTVRQMTTYCRNHRLLMERGNRRITTTYLGLLISTWKALIGRGGIAELMKKMLLDNSNLLWVDICNLEKQFGQLATSNNIRTARALLRVTFED